MNRLIAIAVFALVFTGTSAHAEGGYFSANLRVSMVTDTTVSVLGIEVAEISFDPGFNIGVALGQDFGNYRAEFEIAYREADMDQGAVPGVIAGVVIPGCPCSGSIDGVFSTLSLMVNGYYDFDSADSPFAPYLGAGIGLAIVDGEIAVLGPGDSDAVLAFQLMAGIGYEISPKTKSWASTTLMVGYRYFSAVTDPEIPIFGVPVEFTLAAHEFNVGVRFGF